jgi:hypothetical protein
MTCFNQTIFKPSFDVDTFLSLYKREQPLERLRDDLNIFLKVLEMSMSELINKDYPDFVNLSTNLVRVLAFFLRRFSNLIQDKHLNQGRFGQGHKRIEKTA